MIFDRFVTSICETICGLQFLCLVVFLSGGYNGSLFLQDYGEFREANGGVSDGGAGKKGMGGGLDGGVAGSGGGTEWNKSHLQAVICFVCAGIGLEILQAMLHVVVFNWFTGAKYSPMREFKILFIGVGAKGEKNSNRTRDEGLLWSFIVFATYISTHVYFLIAIKAFVRPSLGMPPSNSTSATAMLL